VTEDLPGTCGPAKQKNQQQSEPTFKPGGRALFALLSDAHPGHSLYAAQLLAAGNDHPRGLSMNSNCLQWIWGAG